MAATFNQLMTIANDANFKNRVNYAMINAAIAVVAESNATANHGKRCDYAKLILDGSANIFQMAIGVLNNATIAAEANSATTPDFAIPDSDIQFAVNSNFNAYSGITT